MLHATSMGDDPNTDSQIKVRIENGILYSPFSCSDVPKCSFYALAREMLKKSPEKLMLVDDSQALTRAECLIRMERYAAGFQAHGVQPGDHVCVHLDNSVENYVAMFGCVFAGAVIVLANTFLTERELYNQVKHADAVHVLTDQKFVQKVANVHARAAFKSLFVMGDATGFVSASTFSHLKESEFKEIPVPDPERTLLGLVYTSGTTGLPKPVEITHYNYVAFFYASAKFFTPTETEVAITWNPIVHSSGLWTLLVALSGVKCVILPTGLGMDKYADAIDKFKATNFACFPSQIRKLAEYVQSTGRKLSTVRHVAVSGDVFSKEAAELVLSVFGSLRSLRFFYMISESRSMICTPPEGVISHTNVGYPGPLFEIKIVDPSNGHTLGPNKLGELCYRSPSASGGYYKHPLESAQFRDGDGWCRSGDLAHYDTDGRVHLGGRIKELIKCLDNQVAPAELEELLLAYHDGIAEVSVVGLPDPVCGEAPAAFVVPKGDVRKVRPAMEKEIKDIIAGDDPNADSQIKVRIENGILHSPFPSLDVPKCSFYTLAREMLKKSPEKLMLADDSQALTRAECLMRMERYAAGFQAHGVQPGDHVCVHLEDSVENYVAMFGCVFAGAAIVLAKNSLTGRELYYQVKHADVVHILTGQKFVQKVANVHAMAPFKGLFLMGEAAGFVSASTFSHLKESEFKEIPVPDPERTLLGLVYTSGTTGLPKPVEITHYNYVAAFYASAKFFTPTETAVVLISTPIVHSSGLWTLLVAITGVKCVILPTGLGMNRYADAIDKFKVTTFGSFPSQIRKLAEYVQSTGRKLRTVRHVIVSGDAFSEEAAKLVPSAFGNLRSLRIFFMMSESRGIICISPEGVISHTDVKYPGSLFEIKIVDPSNGHTLGPNKLGELCYRSPSASRGYYKHPLETAQFRDGDGWCRSGNLAHYDTDGRVHLGGRIKEMIKCLDIQVVPAELEELLLAYHDGIAEVSVVGLPDSVYGEAPAAFVVPKGDVRKVRPAMEKEIKDIIAETCAENKHLYGGVFFVEALPKTDTGKVQKKALVDTWATGAYGSPRNG